MKKLLLVFAISFFLFSAGNVFAVTEPEIWQIKNYVVEVRPAADSHEFDVNEEITVYFDPTVIEENNLRNRGIFKYIPRYYPNKSVVFQTELRVSDFKVTDIDGNDRTFEETFAQNLDSYFLKIGDENIDVDGKQIYNISYHVDNGWRYFEDYDEFYWNVTGNYWIVPIEKASFVFDLRDLGIHASDLDYTCFTGGFGETESECIGAWDKTKQILTVSITDVLDIEEGFSVAISVDKNLIPVFSLGEKIIYFLSANYILLIPWLFLLLMYILWRKKGKDIDHGKPVMAQYIPIDKLSPSAIGELYYLTWKNRNITAEIVYLAVHKYIKIKEVKTEALKVFKGTDYKLILLKKDYHNDKKLENYQKLILTELFLDREEVNIKDLKNSFYKHIPTIKGSVINLLKSKDYLQKDPEQTRGKYIFLIMFSAILMFVLLTPLASNILIPFIVISILFVSAISTILAYLMPRIEGKGVEARWEAQGLYHYLKTAEVERFKFGELRDLFENLLPYAISLNLIHKWAKMMEDFYDQPPEWFEAADPNMANALAIGALAQSFKSMNSSLSSTVASRPSTSSSGGSGFSGGSSGGGFGGGGGGRW